MIDYLNIGKQVIYNRSYGSIDDYVLGTIIGCHIETNNNYYIVSVDSFGKCEEVSDENLLEFI
jgi:hypothetical protein